MNGRKQKVSEASVFKASCLEKMFVQKGEKRPRLRLAGFEGDWVECRLGDMANKITAKNAQSQYSEVLTNSAEFGVIRQRDFFNHSIAKANSISGYYVVEQLDFIYNPRVSVSAPVGPINCNRLGMVGVVSPLYTVFRTHDVNVRFLEYYFKTNLWRQYMVWVGNSGARFDRFSISDEDFFSMPIILPPTVAEQEAIGKFFEDLDKVIELQAKKVEKLRHIKAGCLERMFG